MTEEEKLLAQLITRLKAIQIQDDPRVSERNGVALFHCMDAMSALKSRPTEVSK